MIFSRTSRYALRALAFMADQPPYVPLGIEIISEAAGAPAPYMAKIFQGLARTHLITSQRGKGGGHFLASPPAQINLLEIVDATDDAKVSVLSHCVMGLAECGSVNPCVLHDIWADAAKQMKSELRNTSLEDVAGRMGRLHPHSKTNRKLSKRIREIFV